MEEWETRLEEMRQQALDGYGLNGHQRDQGTDDEPLDDDPLAVLVADLPAADRLAVRDRINRRRLDDLAADLYRQHKAGAAAVEIPDLIPLDAFLDVPDEEASYLVDGLWPTGGRVLAAAQHKAGKTTLVGNLVRCLVDEDQFLDRFTVKPSEGRRVTVLDDELDERMLRRWMRQHRIENSSHVAVLPMRGRLASFNILDPAIRARWAEKLRGTDVLILDCLRPALDALALSEDKDAGRFLEALDALILEAGISELLVVHHMGHAGERSRGDSRILDWPDAVWNLKKSGESHTSPRHFTAYGRDVDQEALELTYAHEGRRLTASTMTRREQYAAEQGEKVDEALEHVLDYLAKQTSEVSRNMTENDLRGKVPSRQALRSAIDRGIDAGFILESTGPRGSKCLTLNPSRRAGLFALPDLP